MAVSPERNTFLNIGMLSSGLLFLIGVYLLTRTTDAWDIMNEIKIISLMVFTATLSSFITYNLLDKPKAHIFKPAKVDMEITVFRSMAQSFCGQYFLNEIKRKDKDKDIKQISKIIDVEGFGFSAKEIYCSINAEIATLKNKTLTKQERKQFYFALNDKTEMTYSELEKRHFNDAFKRYQETFKAH